MDNKYTGEVECQIGEQKGILLFDWAAMSVVQSVLTQQDLDNLVTVPADKLAECLAAGFKAKSPDITKEVIMEASPPIMYVCERFDRAMLYALHGPEDARKILEVADRLNEEAEAALKKNKPPKKP
jgi:hypothetical protein